MFELTPYERRHQRALFNPFRDMENFEKNFWAFSVEKLREICEKL